MLSFRFENGRQIIRLVERSEIAEQIKFRISKENWANLEVYESLELVKEHGKYAILSHTCFHKKCARFAEGKIGYIRLWLKCHLILITSSVHTFIRAASPMFSAIQLFRWP